MIRNYYKFKGNNTLFWIDFMLDSRYADSGLWEFFISGQGGIVCIGDKFICGWRTLVW